MNIIFLVVILIVITIIYINSESYVVDVMNFNKKCTCKDVSCRFYQNYTDINKSNKSKLFIHVSQERNERFWLNFGSAQSRMWLGQLQGVQPKCITLSTNANG